MYLLILFLPLLSFILASFFSKFYGNRGINILSTFLIGLTMILAGFIFFENVLWSNKTVVIFFSRWFDVGLFVVNWSFYFDGLTSIMCVMITVVSFCVHMFSISYMENDFQQEKFMGLLSIFTFFMLILVTSDNFLQLILGWEGVGICSYMLINFWFMRKNTNDSALKALFFNRVGDLGLLLAMFLIYFYLKTFDFIIIFDNYNVLQSIYFSFLFFKINLLDLICYLLIIASMAKSAQVFLNGWLMDAMEGPTPVSALIHAATMVTAGIYLVVRCSALISNSENALFFIILSGSFTTLLCSLIGIDSFDLKRIIASSTASQLGYMFFICGLTEFSSAICHLFYHAFFKALLFLSAGVIIHLLSDEQDIRKMGGLLKKVPLVFLAIFLGSFALIGAPFIGGFYSKDPIIEYSDLLVFVDNIMTFFCCTLGAFNTTYYSVRLISLVFLDRFKGAKIIFSRLHYPSLYMVFPLILLIFFTFLSFITVDIFLGEANLFWFFEEEDVFFFREGEEDVDTFLVTMFFIILGIFFFKNEKIFDFSSFFFSNFILYNSFDFSKFLKNSSFFKWFFDFFYVKFFFHHFTKWSNFIFINFDRGIFESLGPLGIVRFVKNLTKNIIKLQTGFIYHYIFFIILNLILFFLFVKGFFINYKILIIFLFEFSFIKIFFLFNDWLKKKIFVDKKSVIIKKKNNNNFFVSSRKYSTKKNIFFKIDKKKNSLLFFFFLLQIFFFIKFVLRKIFKFLKLFFISFIHIHVKIGFFLTKYLVWYPFLIISNFFFNFFKLIIYSRFFWLFLFFLFFFKFYCNYNILPLRDILDEYYSLFNVPQTFEEYINLNRTYNKFFKNIDYITKKFPLLSEIELRLFHLHSPVKKNDFRFFNYFHPLDFKTWFWHLQSPTEEDFLSNRSGMLSDSYGKRNDQSANVLTSTNVLVGDDKVTEFDFFSKGHYLTDIDEKLSMLENNLPHVFNYDSLNPFKFYFNKFYNLSWSQMPSNLIENFDFVTDAEYELERADVKKEIRKINAGNLMSKIIEMDLDESSKEKIEEKTNEKIDNFINKFTSKPKESLEAKEAMKYAEKLSDDISELIFKRRALLQVYKILFTKENLFDNNRLNIYFSKNVKEEFSDKEYQYLFKNYPKSIETELEADELEENKYKFIQIEKKDEVMRLNGEDLDKLEKPTGLLELSSWYQYTDNDMIETGEGFPILFDYEKNIILKRFFYKTKTGSNSKIIFQNFPDFLLIDGAYWKSKKINFFNKFNYINFVDGSFSDDIISSDQISFYDFLKSFFIDNVSFNEYSVLNDQFFSFLVEKNENKHLYLIKNPLINILSQGKKISNKIPVFLSDSNFDRSLNPFLWFVLDAKSSMIQDYETILAFQHMGNRFYFFNKIFIKNSFLPYDLYLFPKKKNKKSSLRVLENMDEVYKSHKNSRFLLKRLLMKENLVMLLGRDVEDFFPDQEKKKKKTIVKFKTKSEEKSKSDFKRIFKKRLRADKKFMGFLPFNYYNTKWILIPSKFSQSLFWFHRDGFKNILPPFYERMTSSIFWKHRRRFSRFFLTEKEIFRVWKYSSIPKKIILGEFFFVKILYIFLPNNILLLKLKYFLISFFLSEFLIFDNFLIKQYLILLCKCLLITSDDFLVGLIGIFKITILSLVNFFFDDLVGLSFLYSFFYDEVHSYVSLDGDVGSFHKPAVRLVPPYMMSKFMARKYKKSFHFRPNFYLWNYYSNKSSIFEKNLMFKSLRRKQMQYDGLDKVSLKKIIKHQRYAFRVPYDYNKIYIFSKFHNVVDFQKVRVRVLPYIDYGLMKKKSMLNLLNYKKIKPIFSSSASKTGKKYTKPFSFYFQNNLVRKRYLSSQFPASLFYTIPENYSKKNFISYNRSNLLSNHYLNSSFFFAGNPKIDYSINFSLNSNIKKNYSIFKFYKKNLNFLPNDFLLNYKKWIKNSYKLDLNEKSLFLFFHLDTDRTKKNIEFFNEFFFSFGNLFSENFDFPFPDYSSPFYLYYIKYNLNSNLPAVFFKNYDFISNEIYTYDNSLLFERFSFDPNWRNLNPYSFGLIRKNVASKRPDTRNLGDISGLFSFVDKPNSRQNKYVLAKHFATAEDFSFVKKPHREFKNFEIEDEPDFKKVYGEYEKKKDKKKIGSPAFNTFSKYHEIFMAERNQSTGRPRSYIIVISTISRFIFKFYYIYFSVVKNFFFFFFFCYKQIILIIIFVIFLYLYVKSVQLIFYEYNLRILKFKIFLIKNKMLYFSDFYDVKTEKNYNYFHWLSYYFPDIFYQKFYKISPVFLKFRLFIFIHFLKNFFYNFFYRAFLHSFDLFIILFFKHKNSLLKFFVEKFFFKLKKYFFNFFFIFVIFLFKKLIYLLKKYCLFLTFLSSEKFFLFTRIFFSKIYFSHFLKYSFLYCIRFFFFIISTFCIWCYRIFLYTGTIALFYFGANYNFLIYGKYFTQTDPHFTLCLFIFFILWFFSLFSKIWGYSIFEPKFPDYQPFLEESVNVNLMYDLDITADEDKDEESSHDIPSGGTNFYERDYIHPELGIGGGLEHIPAMNLNVKNHQERKFAYKNSVKDWYDEDLSHNIENNNHHDFVSGSYNYEINEFLEYEGVSLDFTDLSFLTLEEEYIKLWEKININAFENLISKQRNNNIKFSSFLFIYNFIKISFFRLRWVHDAIINENFFYKKPKQILPYEFYFYGKDFNNMLKNNKFFVETQRFFLAFQSLDILKILVKKPINFSLRERLKQEFIETYKTYISPFYRYFRKYHNSTDNSFSVLEDFYISDKYRYDIDELNLFSEFEFDDLTDNFFYVNHLEHPVEDIYREDLDFSENDDLHFENFDEVFPEPFSNLIGIDEDSIDEEYDEENGAFDYVIPGDHFQYKNFFNLNDDFEYTSQNFVYNLQYENLNNNFFVPLEFSDFFESNMGDDKLLIKDSFWVNEVIVDRFLLDVSQQNDLQMDLDFLILAKISQYSENNKMSFDTNILKMKSLKLRRNIFDFIKSLQCNKIGILTVKLKRNLNFFHHNSPRTLGLNDYSLNYYNIGIDLSFSDFDKNIHFYQDFIKKRAFIISYHPYNFRSKKFFDFVVISIMSHEIFDNKFKRKFFSDPLFYIKLLKLKNFPDLTLFEANRLFLYLNCTKKEWNSKDKNLIKKEVIFDNILFPILLGVMMATASLRKNIWYSFIEERFYKFLDRSLFSRLFLRIDSSYSGPIDYPGVYVRYDIYKTYTEFRYIFRDLINVFLEHLFFLYNFLFRIKLNFLNVDLEYLIQTLNVNNMSFELFRFWYILLNHLHISFLIKYLPIFYDFFFLWDKILISISSFLIFMLLLVLKFIKFFSLLYVFFDFSFLLEIFDFLFLIFPFFFDIFNQVNSLNFFNYFFYKFFLFFSNTHFSLFIYYSLPLLMLFLFIFLNLIDSIFCLFIFLFKYILNYFVCFSFFIFFLKYILFYLF